jgi:hypothetical protein
VTSFSAPLPTTSWGLPLVGCPQVLIQYIIFSYFPYPEGAILHSQSAPYRGEKGPTLYVADIKRKVKVKLCLWTKCRVMKTYWVVQVYFHAFFYHGIRWKWVVRFTFRMLYPRERAPSTHSIGDWGGPQSRSGHRVEEENSRSQPGSEPRSSDRPAHSQSLYRLSYPDS